MRRALALLALTAVILAAVASTAAARTRADANIVQTAVAAGQFKTLTKLLTRAGLVGALEQPGPYTVFAPTDAAFKKVPNATLKALLRNRAKLKAVLLYHVVSGQVNAADVVKLSSAKTLNGKSVRIRTAGMNVFVNSAKVTKADVTASNGVVHVINRVLIPPAG
ncbi:MAG TPA: fasciclin domain-containing protein [Gaiellaceae bacterium]|nr:fasciclin domain-containing protein [Gaiellaceae bacterium]